MPYPTPPEGVSLRRATVDDVPALLRLMDGAVAWLTAQGRTGQWGDRPMSAEPARAAQMTEMIGGGDFWVATTTDETPDGRTTTIVGAFSVGKARDYVPPATEPALHLQLLVTDRGWKGRGLGRFLVARARAMAEEAAVDVLRVDCYAGGDGKLVRWYESVGFAQAERFLVQDTWPGQVLVMRLSQPSSGGPAA